MYIYLATWRAERIHLLYVQPFDEGKKDTIDFNEFDRTVSVILRGLPDEKLKGTLQSDSQDLSIWPCSAFSGVPGTRYQRKRHYHAQRNTSSRPSD